MANATDAFLLIVVPSGADDPIAPTFTWGSSSQTQTAVSGQKYALNFTFSIGKPPETVFSSDINKKTGQPAGSPAKAADLIFNPASAPTTYVDPNTGLTVDYGPEEIQNGGANGTAPTVTERTEYDGQGRIGTPAL